MLVEDQHMSAEDQNMLAENPHTPAEDKNTHVLDKTWTDSSHIQMMSIANVWLVR